jgi:IS30 family transposase
MSRKVLTLSERVEAIKLHDGGKSSRDVAQIMGVGRMQIQQIIKRKSEVLDDYESNVSNDRKRKKHKTGNEDINDLCWDWLQDAIRCRINVTGPMIHMYMYIYM